MSQTTGFGWVGGFVAKDMGVVDQEFCPAALWPSVPVWLLETPKVDLELIEARMRHKKTDLVNEHYCHIENRYRVDRRIQQLELLH